VFQPDNPNACLIALPSDGVTVAYAGYGGTFSQDLGVKPSDLEAVSRDGIFVMNFSVANYFTVYPGYYEAKLSIGAQELCSTDGWATWHTTAVTFVCPSPGYLVYDKIFPDGFAGGPAPADHNAHLKISFVGYGWTVMFDDVSLTFTPN